MSAELGQYALPELFTADNTAYTFATIPFPKPRWFTDFYLTNASTPKETTQ